ncbi:uncharacterized protein J4E78_001598 [Alternaria triticimaculans]|uniref:uncharacterized protein n=1 Tax=Alternaria triticimaculans TaxID=297637 RepID=UPI0020C4710D|nr:uncharacterized protein J4E78_001598 [Alternaria triticimaculans]KAI4673092.1 hypothetical protein J4E78_001598 [Alternaria triticimaculans]
MAAPSIQAPQLMGITGDNCASCQSTTVPLYDLPCHESDDFHCRDCLTKTFHAVNDQFVRCPHPSCRRIVGFEQPIPLARDLRLDNEFYDQERIDKIREQPEVMNNLIAFVGEEAEVILQHVYTMFEDQLLNPVALGGVAGHYTAGVANSLVASFACNPFVCGLLAQIKDTFKLMTTPYELEEDLNTLLDRLLHEYAQLNYGNELTRHGIDLEHEGAVLAAALNNYKPFNELKENWELIIKKWVELLAWRHLERLAPPEGGAAERKNRQF